MIYKYDVFICVCLGPVFDVLLLQNIIDWFWLWLCWYWSTDTFQSLYMALSKVSEMDNTMTKSKRTTELIIIHKTLHRKLKLEQLKPRGKLVCSGRENSSCSTCGTCRVTLVTNPMISHEWGIRTLTFEKCAIGTGSF